MGWMCGCTCTCMCGMTCDASMKYKHIHMAHMHAINDPAFRWSGKVCLCPSCDPCVFVYYLPNTSWSVSRDERLTDVRSIVHRRPSRSKYSTTACVLLFPGVCWFSVCLPSRHVKIFIGSICWVTSRGFVWYFYVYKSLPCIFSTLCSKFAQQRLN